jgi:hypothetical protein
MTDGIDRGSLFRQRRLLLATTFALVAFHYLRATLAQQISTSVVEFKYDASRLEVGVALWVTWVWALVRYSQYERAFRNDALEHHRTRVTSSICLVTVTKQLQRAVSEGAYQERGLTSDHTIEAAISPEGLLTPFLESNGAWTFPNLTARFRPSNSNDWSWLQGGANCSFDPSEVTVLRRKIEQHLMTHYPHFTDFKFPYFIASMAPLSATVDAVRFLLS